MDAKKMVTGVPAALRAVEMVLSDNAAGLVSLAGGVLPAGMAYQGMTETLAFPGWLAVTGLVVIEGLNIGATNTALRLWQRGDKRLWLGLGAVGFYLFSVITVNVLLDTGDGKTKLAKALLSSVSIVGAIVVALRWQLRQDEERERAEAVAAALADEAAQARQRELEDAQRALQAQIDADEREAKRQAAADRRAMKHELSLKKLETESFGKKKVSESSEKVSEGSEKFPETFGKWSDWRKVPSSERNFIASLEDWQNVAERYGTSEKTSKNWLKNARR